MSSLRDELLAVRARMGSLTPENVVAVARDESSPLHHRFEWDDSAAAEKYRVLQAQELIRKVRIKFADSEDGPKDVRAFVAVRERACSRAVYEPTEDVLADPFSRRLLLQECRREWAAFERKYQHLEEFAEIVGREVVAA